MLVEESQAGQSHIEQRENACIVGGRGALYQGGGGGNGGKAIVSAVEQGAERSGRRRLVGGREEGLRDGVRRERVEVIRVEQERKVFLGRLEDGRRSRDGGG